MNIEYKETWGIKGRGVLFAFLAREPAIDATELTERTSERLLILFLVPVKKQMSYTINLLNDLQLSGHHICC